MASIRRTSVTRTKKIYMLKGLPGSMKSTKAQEIITSNPNALRVNKDDLRTMLHLSDYSSAHEKTVVAMEHILVGALLAAGKDVIVDDTNFNPKYTETYGQLAREHTALLEVIEMDNDVEACIARDAKRGKTFTSGRSVGADVIRNMALQQGILQQLRPIAVFNADILGDAAHRMHLIQNAEILVGTAKPDWPAFYGQCYLDAVKPEMLAKMQEYKEMGYELVIVSAYPEEYRDMKTRWFKGRGIPVDRIIMRPDGNYEPGDSLMQKFLLNYMTKDMVEVWYEDRPMIIRMLRRNGINVEDVGSGVEY